MFAVCTEQLSNHTRNSLTGLVGVFLYILEEKTQDLTYGATITYN